VDKIVEALNVRKRPLNGARILVAGVAYKRDIDDIRESPSLDVMTVLMQSGARVRYSDPHVPVLRADRWQGAVELHSEPLTAAALAQADCVVILTDHRDIDYELVRRSAAVVVDTRNAIEGRHPNVFRLGAPAPRDTAAIARDAGDACLSDDAAPDAQAVA
jgi:UDP-N-acetyl-D-glucosamine dehydrogenase